MHCNMPARGWFRAVDPGRRTGPDPSSTPVCHNAGYAAAAAEAGKAATARSGDAVGELSRLVAELVNEQVRANVEALQALGRARTWPEVLEAHAAFFRGNLERMSEGSGRYLEAVTRLAAGAGGGGHDKDKEAA